MSPASPAPPAIRRAVDADAPAVAALLSREARPAATEDRATFVMEADGRLIGALELVQTADHLAIDCIAVAADMRGHGHGKLLVAFAEAAAREIEARELSIGPRVTANGFFTALGYTGGRKRVAGGSIQLARQHLEAVGVPLLRDGSGTLGRTVYYRAVWTAIAIIVGVGSISLAAFGRGQLTIVHLALPAILCLAGTAFAFWQLVLVIVAARRVSRAARSLLAMAAAVAAMLAIADTIYDKAVPQLAELWAIYQGDVERNDFVMVVSPDGRALHFEGSLGIGTEKAMQQVLDEHPAVREVVLAGPGGRLGAAYEIFHMLRRHRLATRVDGECASACTIMFLGGVERRVSPGAVLAFHQAGFPGMSKADVYDSNRYLTRFLIVQAGLTSAFANRVVDTPPDTVWVPTLDELKAGRVVK